MSFVGYLSEVTQHVELSAGETRVLNIELIPTTIDINGIIVQSVSRRPEKLVEAPAAVSILEAKDIQGRPALTPAEHLKSLPAVDIISTGLMQSRIALRGFNRMLGDPDKLLVLMDNRNTRFPSLRYNLSGLLTISDEDIERIEVVSGPGSALYGPNAANGVMQIITKSPFESQGTHISAGGGERDLLFGSFRHAGVLSHRLGYKISGRYYKGTDWKYDDIAEPDSVVRGLNTLNGRVNQGGLVKNDRNYDIDKKSLDARIDFKITPDLELILSSGFAESSSIELTDAGAIQGVDWSSNYIQGRITSKNFFAQVFVNQGSFGDSYNLRSGDLIIDNSRLFAAQIQHTTTILQEKQRFIYGADLYLTRPNTENTIFGRNEEMDNVNEYGFYLQSETRLTPQLKVVVATRLDDHSRTEYLAFSPRIGLAYNPHPNHNLRLTYNRAFTSPSSGLLFLDISIIPSLGPLPYALRGRGLPGSGFSFRRDDSGGIDGLYMQSPFTPPELGGRVAELPADATPYWGVIVGFLQAQNIDLSQIPPPSSNQVASRLMMINTATLGFDVISPAALTDLDPFKPTITNALELGYMGFFGTNFLLKADLFYNSIENFAQFGIQTPSVMFEPESLSAYLEQFMPEVDATALADAISSIPIGTVMMQEITQDNPADLIFTWRVFEESIKLFGADFSFTHFLNSNWRIGGFYSFVSKDSFQKDRQQFQEFALNAPRHKFGGRLQYQDIKAGFEAELRFRYIHSFPVISGVYKGTLDSYSVLDLTSTWALPFSRHTSVSLSIQNLLGQKHQEHIGSPKIGRLGMLRVSHTF